MDLSFLAVMELFYPLLLGAGILSCIRLLLVGNKNIRIPNGLLVVLLFCLSVPMWNVYVAQVLGSNSLALRGPVVHSYWLVAPLMYLYLNEILSSEVNRRFYVLHSLPFLVVVVVQKMVHANVLSLDKLAFFKFCILVWSVVSLGYLVALVRVLVCARREYLAFYSSTLAKEFKWSLALVLGLMLFVVFDLLLGIYILADRPYPSQLETSFVVIRSLYVVGIISYTLYSRLDLKEVLELPIKPKEPSDASASLRLSESSAKALEAELEKAMEDEALFSSPDLNLSGLAEHMGVSTHQLSEVFNVHMSTSFYRYVNERRINHAKTLLKEAPDTPIVDIAFLCGYGSKTTFYDNFKKICSMTPKEFRAAAS